MAVKFGSPFGLDKAAVEEIDWELVVDQIINDIKSDFIYAPHIAHVYRKNRAALIHQVKAELVGGKFLPSEPLTLEVPKSSTIRISSRPIRRGPNYTRPGSILLPKDRLLYQMLANAARQVVSDHTDSSRSFSHSLDEDNPDRLFLSTRVCWNQFQQRLAELSADEENNYILKIDIANFFSSINQHTLVNSLQEHNYPNSLTERLENLLTTFSKTRSSRGIVQGIFPSDMFGNYYLNSLDQVFSDRGVKASRYVDDIYIFVKSVSEAEKVLLWLIPELRGYDLTLNESKCIIFPKAHRIVEEPDLEALFTQAVAEISGQLEDEDFESDYGFQAAWDDEDPDDDYDDDDDDGAFDLELAATKALFDSIEQYEGHEESIERFCLPLFAKAESDYAVDHVLTHFDERPSMAQIYCSYLMKFLGENRVKHRLSAMLVREGTHDWQAMWMLASLLNAPGEDEGAMSAALAIYSDANRSEALRAVAALYVGKFGAAARRRVLTSTYSRETEYIRAAIYFISRFWPGPDRKSARDSWGNRGELNKLIV